MVIMMIMVMMIIIIGLYLKSQSVWIGGTTGTFTRNVPVLNPAGTPANLISSTDSP
jgi:hypothetical protein